MKKMPYPNEHACRLEEPGKYEKFSRKNCGEKHEGKCIDVIYGIKSGKSEIQALRYKKDVWDEDDARAHCKSRKGKFEAAADEEDSLKDGQEIRTYEIDSLEVREAGEGKGKKIAGHAAVFGKLSEDLGRFREIIEAGAFADTIKHDDIRALFNHIPSYILGRNKAGTLVLEEDERGLYFEIDMPDTQYARDLMVSIGRKDISQCSFAFRVEGKKGEHWEVDGKECEAADAFMAMWDGEKHKIIRHVDKARLYDVSPVTYAAYPQTDVKTRAADYKEMNCTTAEEESAGAEAMADKPDEEGALKGRALSLARQRLNFK
ncbi:MAG: hypothetical protein A2Y89_07045 [Chloroflexi bacterium RBG_13_51_18]|nr:MAG: hypothetical protein A2Y89_07045 [Chloroflexi bacterium RBG_13_51_18]